MAKNRQAGTDDPGTGAGKVAASRPRGRAHHRGLRAALALVLLVKVVVAGLWWQGGLAGAAARTAGPESGTAVGSLLGAGAGSADSAVKSDAREAGPTATAGGAALHQPAETTAPRPQLKNLLDALAQRQAELDAREQELARQQELLKVFEKDVTAKLSNLEEIEKRLSTRAKVEKAALDAAQTSLAKIYGAMKPSDAAPILEHLDEETVLRIFVRMKEKQVGEILPLMSRDKAIILTRSLADRH